MANRFIKKNVYVCLLFFCIHILIQILSPIQTFGEEKRKESVRPPAVAGTFYPGSPSQLRNKIKSFHDKIPEVKPEGRILAAIAPHAGYVYSGEVAAYMHKRLSAVEFETIIIIGHDSFRNAVAFTCPVDYFKTPLGKIAVDREMMERMHLFDPGIKPDRALHAYEHTVEVHLPFLQVQKRQCKIVPILFGNPTKENCRTLSDAIIAASEDKKVFVLASTDLSHYPSYTSACEVDNSTLDVIKTLDVENFFVYLKKLERHSSVPNLRTAVCASGGVGTAIFFAKAMGANHAKVLRYANSGDVAAGDKHRVVGYSSVLFVERNINSSDTDQYP